jgi:hypothetical protein
LSELAPKILKLADEKKIPLLENLIQALHVEDKAEEKD